MEEFLQGGKINRLQCGTGECVIQEGESESLYREDLLTEAGAKGSSSQGYLKHIKTATWLPDIHAKNTWANVRGKTGVSTGRSETDANKRHHPSAACPTELRLKIHSHGQYVYVLTPPTGRVSRRSTMMHGIFDALRMTYGIEAGTHQHDCGSLPISSNINAQRLDRLYCSLCLLPFPESSVPDSSDNEMVKMSSSRKDPTSAYGWQLGYKLSISPNRQLGRET